MTAYLADTNVVSELFAPFPNRLVRRRIHEFRGQVAIASTTWHELMFGCARLPPSKRRSELEETMERVVRPAFRILPYNEAAATWHAGQRALLVARGRTPSYPDGQIASVAATVGLILATRNVRDFEGFGIPVENWFDP